MSALPLILDTDLDTDCDDVGALAIGTYPAGRDVFNWIMDLEGAGRILNDWPAELAVSPAGEDVQTGAALSGACPAANPFRRAYEIHRGGLGRSRSSWDQVALLYAARLAPERFQEIAGKGLRFDAASGQHAWLEAPSQAPRRHVLPRSGADALAGIIEPLMVEGATAPG